MAKRVNRDDLEQLIDCDVHVPTRTLTLFGEIDRDACEKIVKNLHVLDTASADPIIILMNSEGGDDCQGQAIYEAIASARSHCTIIGVGEVASIAAAIFQAADLRILRPRAEFMIHYGSREVHANTVDFKNASKVQDENDRWYEDVLLERIRDKHPSFPLSKLRKWLREDTYFKHDEVLAWGLSDQ